MCYYDDLHWDKAAPVKVNSRYALSEHIVVLGIELQKSDTAFLPRHSTKEDVHAGMEERDSATNHIKDASSMKGLQDL